MIYRHKKSHFFNEHNIIIKAIKFLAGSLNFLRGGQKEIFFMFSTHTHTHLEWFCFNGRKVKLVKQLHRPRFTGIERTMMCVIGCIYRPTSYQSNATQKWLKFVRNVPRDVILSFLLLLEYPIIYKMLVIQLVPIIKLLSISWRQIRRHN